MIAKLPSGIVVALITVTAWARAEDAVAPKEPLKLFDGKTLAGWYPYVEGEGRGDKSTVFSVQDGAIRASGERNGYLATERAYRDYHLTFEFRWGNRTDGTKVVRNSGVLLHGVGPDGGAGGQWMTSIECQLAQGCEGDLIVIRGRDDAGKQFPATITSETVLGPDGRTRWKRGGQKTIYSGKQFWWNDHDHDFKEILDTRGRWDVSTAGGLWNRVECSCNNDRITIVVNSATVNECEGAKPSAGRILLQSEGAEVLFRNIELRPIQRSSD